MDPRKIIKEAAEDERYDLNDHAIEERDKDGLSMEDVETVMILGKINQRNPNRNRYRLRYRDIQIVVEIHGGEVYVVTVMKDQK